MAIAGDAAVVTVSVGVEPAEAFRLFTEEIDRWWRQGPRYRVGRGGVLRLEPKVGGRLFESVQTDSGPRVIETGRVTTWQPPRALGFEWRATNFAPAETTQVEVCFEPSASGTRVTLRHAGWSSIRPDHPARHGDDERAFLRSMGLWWGELLSSLREHASR